MNHPWLTSHEAFALVFCLTINLHPTPASTSKDEKKQALTHYRKAVELAKNEMWKEALESFVKSKDLGAPPVVYYNIARCHEEMQNYQEAINNYNKYLEKGELKEGEKKEIKARIEHLRNIPSTVTFHTSPRGAIIIERKKDKNLLLGKAPFTTRINTGKHQFIIREKNYQDKKIDINACCGKKFNINVILQPGTKKATPAGAKHQKTKNSKLNLFASAGGGLSLFPFSGVSFQANGNFCLEMLKGFAVKRFVPLIGINLTGNFYKLDSRSGTQINSMFFGIAAIFKPSFTITSRFIIEPEALVGFLSLIPFSRKVSENEITILGGGIEGSAFPYFKVGVNLSARINLTKSGFYLIIKPVQSTLATPLKTIYAKNKLLYIYSFSLLTGYKF